jgi:hypothetical protein
MHLCFFFFFFLKKTTKKKTQIHLKNGSGTYVWRIEQGEPVLVDPAFHGSFYSGDA